MRKWICAGLVRWAAFGWLIGSLRYGKDSPGSEVFASAFIIATLWTAANFLEKDIKS